MRYQNPSPTPPICGGIHTQATASTEGRIEGKGKGKEKGKKPPATTAHATQAPSGSTPRQTSSPPPKSRSPNTKRVPTKQARTIVLHAAPTKYKHGQVRRWIEGRGVFRCWGYAGSQKNTEESESWHPHWSST